MKMYIDGEWVSRDHQMEVINPYNGEAFEAVPRGSVEDVNLAVEAGQGASGSTPLTRCWSPTD